MTLAAVVLAGVALRLAYLAIDANFDFESYEIVASIREGGGNVYAETTRYNYGPLWFIVIDGLARIARAISDDSSRQLRVLIVGVLTAADAVVAVILWRRFSAVAGLVAWFAPITLFVTGAHNQFENLAVATALVALVVLGERTGGRLVAHEWSGLVLLGLSITIKHIAVFFVLMMVWRQRGVIRKLIYGALPLLVFGSAFVPFLADGGATGIRENVIGYRSFENFPLCELFLGTSNPVLGWTVLAVALVVFTLLTRTTDLITTFAGFLVVLVVFSPSIAAQQMVLLVPWVAINLSPFLAAWLVAEGYFLLVDGRARVSDGQAVATPLFDQLYELRIGPRAYTVRIALFVLAVGLTALRASDRDSPAVLHSIRERIRREYSYQRRGLATLWGDRESDVLTP